MKSPPVKPSWVDRCIDIHNFHVSQIRAEKHWTLADTAKALNRSIGSISQSLTLASWLRTHDTKLKKFSTARDALEFIRGKKKDIKCQEID